MPCTKTLPGASNRQPNEGKQAGSPNFQFVRVLRGHAAAVSGVVYQPENGKVLLSCSADRTVKMWDGESGEELRTLSVSLRVILECY